MGIIDSLSAGYRVLSRHVQVILLPVLVDLAFILLPRLSVEPLYQSLAELYGQAAQFEGMPADMAGLTGQVAQMLLNMGEQSNLWTLLANGALLHVPSLMAVLGPRPGSTGVELSDPLLVAGLALLFTLCGIIIGVIYLNLLVRYVPIGNGDKPADLSRFVRAVGRHTLRVIGFVLVVGFGMLALYIPATVVSVVAAMLSPLLSSLVFFLLSGLTLLVFIYLYFVVAALVMDDLSIREAIRQSVQLVRTNFVAAMGFYLLTALIGLGFVFIFVRVAEFSTIGLLAALVANAYLGTGLTIAWLIFYRTRILRVAEEVALLDREHR